MGKTVIYTCDWCGCKLLDKHYTLTVDAYSRGGTENNGPEFAMFDMWLCEDCFNKLTEHVNMKGEKE